jgi:prepilin-type N-terminal cleavage/methylation domain-containing protein
MVRRTRRQGYTLLELMAVMAALVVLGVMILPTLSGIRGNTNLKGGADTIRALLAQARAKAIEDGKNYKLTFSTDGRIVRIEPDVNAITGEAVQPDADDRPIVRQEELPKGVTVAILELLDDGAPIDDGSGVQRVATLLPDGTCREDSVFIQLTEANLKPLTLRIRGLTGNITVVDNPTTSGTGAMP